MSGSASDEYSSEATSDSHVDSVSPGTDSDVDEASRSAHSNIQNEISSLSFGALVSAHDVIKREHDGKDGDIRAQSSASDEKLQAIRSRLAKLRDAKDGVTEHRGAVSRTRAEKSASASASARLSKHAPSEISSKHAVTRKRPALEISKNPTNSRDPRFLSVHGSVNEEKVRKNYAFLNDYRQHELGEIKAAIKKAKTDKEKGLLQKEQMAMENRERADAERARERKVLQEHRKKEKQLVQQGKNPFYLKRSEQKRQALIAKFEGMKGKERAKAMERRRKKTNQREKRNMPVQRRRGDEY